MDAMLIGFIVVCAVVIYLLLRRPAKPIKKPKPKPPEGE
jgi:hypothetical protein